MTNKYFGGVVERSGVTEALDEELKEMAENILVEIKTGPPYVYG